MTNTNTNTKRTVGTYNVKKSMLYIVEFPFDSKPDGGRLVRFTFVRKNREHVFYKYMSRGLQGATFYLKKLRGERFHKHCTYNGTPYKIVEDDGTIGFEGAYTYAFFRGE